MSADAKKENRKKDRKKAKKKGAAPAGGATAEEKTTLESSVRLSEEAKKKYEEMARESATQKTDILSHAAQRLAEAVATAPKRKDYYAGRKKAGKKPAADPPKNKAE